MLCYTLHTYNAAIMGVNKLIRNEATSFLYDGNPCLLYIYLIFKGDKACGSAVGGGLSAALEAFSKSMHFPHVCTCIIDIRLFCEKYEGVAPQPCTFEELSKSVEAICDTVSQSPALRQVEVSWCDYFTDDLRAQKRKALQPLGKLQVMFNARDRVVEKTDQRSRRRFADCPHMLKPYRRLDFSHSSFNGDENDEVESRTFRPPHPSDIDVFGAGTA